MKFAPKKYFCAVLVSTVITCFFSMSVHGQQGFWKEIPALPGTVTQKQQPVKQFRLTQFNIPLLQQYLSGAPDFLSGSISNVIVEMPLADGTSLLFRVYQNNVLVPAIAAAHPEIRTYSGQTTDAMTTLRLTVSPYGIEARIAGGGGITYLTPYSNTTPDIVIAYDARQVEGAENVVCGVKTPEMEESLQQLGLRQMGLLSADNNLRTYVISVAATGEYTSWAGSQAQALAKITTTVNNINAIYERDLAIHFTVNSPNSILYTVAGSDPYVTSASPTAAILDANLAAIDANVGPANYDLGHVFNAGWSGGLAQLSSVCLTTAASTGKARAASGITVPSGPVFDNIVAHETGHQFSATHAFAANNGGCSGNTTPSTGWEPGGGSTIMSYAGTCTGNAYQSNNDYYFHGGNLAQMSTFMTTTGNACATLSATGNTSPTATTTATTYNIPNGTPFRLTATETDAENDVLTSCWEQLDAIGGTGTSSPPSATSTSGPLFRSFPPVYSPTRYFPSLPVLVGINSAVYEVLPTVIRAMNFRLSVRDNHASGGLIQLKDVVVNTLACGPFSFTSHTTSGSLTANGSNTTTLTWNTASCATCTAVNVKFSTDGGNTYPYTLLSSTPNDGTQAITIPNLPTCAGRFMLECTDNIFFNINAADQTITSTCTANGASITPTTTLNAAAPGAGSLNTGEAAVYGSAISNPLTGSVTASSAAGILTVFNSATTSCQTFNGNLTNYNVVTFVPSATGSYTFNAAGSTSGLVYDLYDSSFYPNDPCRNFLKSSGTYNGTSVSLSNSITVTLCNKKVYTLVISTFNTGSPALPASYTINVTGGTLFTNTPNPGLNYSFVIVNNSTGNVVAVQSTGNMTNTVTFPTGNYTMYGISSSSTAATLNSSFAGTSFAAMNTAVLNQASGLCAQFSTNSRLINIAGCSTITVTNPVTTTGTTGTAFSQTFTQTGAVGGATFSINTGTLPTGLNLAPTTGILSGTPTQGGTFPITIKVTDGNSCTGIGPTYNLVINCPTITVTNPVTTTGTANTAFSQTFTQTGATGGATFTINTGTLPTGLSLNPSTGVLSGTPTQTGSFPITVKVTSGHGCIGIGGTYTLVIGCQTITVTNPATTTGTTGTAFSQTFTQTGSIGTVTFSLNTGTLPTGLSLAPLTGVLSGTPTQGGTFPITIKVTDGNSCTGIGPTYNLVINCPTITVTNPVTTTGTANTAFSQTFTQTGATGGATFTINTGTLPTGLSLNPSTGVLSGTPTQTGSFPLTVKVTSGHGCIGTGGTYTLVIGCQSITVTNPATTTGTTGTAFSQTFTQTGSIGTVTFSLNSGTLPTGLSLAPLTGVLSGTPTQGGTFPITIKVTDGNSCTGIGPTYNLVINCPTITVTNPVTTTGTANTAFSQTFTQTGATGGATFTINTGTLPTGLSLNPSTGVLSGTPTQTGSFPITVKVTSGHGCIGTGGTYALVIGCQTITVTNPVTTTGTTGTAFSQTFTQTGSIGTVTFSLNSGTLPTGLSLAPLTGVLSGTPTQGGTFPITIKVTDGNGCTGIGPTYNLVINCPTITVTNPVTTTGTANTAFSQTFTQTGATGGATFTINTGTLPTGLSLNPSTGVLSGTPTQTGSFPITVKVTSGHGCIGIGGTYTLVIGCQTITVTNPVTTTGTIGTAFSQTFTQTGSIGTVSFSINTGTLPTGLTLAPTTGILSGTPTQGGTFPITIKVTDGNSCTGIGPTYNLVINCPTITVTNPVTTTGTANTAFSQTFTQTGAGGGAMFSVNSGTLPTGLNLSIGGTLSGTPTQTGTFPITIKVTAGNGCTGIGPTYNLVINCQTINVTNPVTTTGTANTAFSQTFTQTGAIGGANFTINTGTLPAGLSLAPTTGILSGTPTQSGPFPITVKVTDGNGCTGIGITYNLVINCQTITVTNPGTATGLNGVAFSQTFTQTGAVGGATFTINTGTLPTGLNLAPTTGILSGTPTQSGTFPITIKVTGGNGCTGTGTTYNLVISNCAAITVTNPVTTSGLNGVAFSQTFTQTGAVGGATFTINTGTLPTGLNLAPTTGILSGTPTQSGSFPITIKVTGGNGCTGTGTTYNLVISNCAAITVTNPGTASGLNGVAFSQTFTQTGAVGGATFSINTGTLPTGLSLAPTTGVLSGTPTQSGTFPITIKVTGGNGCTGTGTTYNLVISNCAAITVTNPATTSGTTGTPFSQTFTQTGAVGGATFSINTGTLPTGLTLAPATGVLSGTPTQSGTFPLTIKVTGGNGCTGTGITYNLVISGTATITVNLKLFLQGYYIGSNTMQPVLNNQAVPGSSATQTDTLIVELYHASTFAFIDQKKVVLLTNGSVSATFTQPAGSYYIGIRHRNSVQTWTANAVACTASTPLYNFTIAANKAFGDNQVELDPINEPGVFGFYVGDLNQDEFIDAFDYSGYNDDNLAGVNGVYIETDMNGDGFVDAFDYSQYNDNNLAGIQSIHP